MLSSMFLHFISGLGWRSSYNWKDFWDIAAHIAQVLGFAAGGVWAYFNFVKSRTYYPRMELSVSAEHRLQRDKQYLVPRVTLRNIGNSKVALPIHGTGYRVWMTKGDTDGTGELVWLGGTVVYSIFEDHDWIEPGEMIFDEIRMFEVSSDCVATKVQVRLTAPVGWRRRTTAWNCSTIVGPSVGEETSK